MWTLLPMRKERMRPNIDYCYMQIEKGLRDIEEPQKTKAMWALDNLHSETLRLQGVIEELVRQLERKEKSQSSTSSTKGVQND